VSVIRYLPWVVVNALALVTQSCTGNGSSAGGAGNNGSSAGGTGNGSSAGGTGAGQGTAGASQGGISGQQGRGGAQQSEGGSAQGPAGSSGTAGTDVDAGTRVISGITILRLQNSLCFPPQTILPRQDAGGSANCRIVIASVSGGCDVPGLSMASESDVSEVTVLAKIHGEVAAAPFCDIAQLDAESGTACAAETAVGWCYVQGPCAAQMLDPSCESSICTTPAFASAQIAEQSSWLICE
jgi:hypothetical protein